MTVSIVILNWNGKQYLEKFLPTLIAHTQIIGVEIIVADNASSDGSLEMLRLQFPSIRVIVLDQNYGFAGGYNKALMEIKAEYYVLLNSDVEVTPNWLEPLLLFMREHSNVAACQPKIKAFHNKNFFEHAGASGGFIDRFGYPFCRGRLFGFTEEDKGQYDSIVDVFWASGACLFVRSEMFWRVGGLDDVFFAHMEEIDLCWRMKSRGLGVVAIPQSVVYHVGGGTLNAESPYKTYLNFRNNLLLLYKNLPNQSLNQTLFARFIFDYLAALQFVFAGKAENAKSIIKARSDFYQMKSNFAQKRKLNLQHATVHQIPEILQKSIVFEYFINKKKVYLDLFK